MKRVEILNQLPNYYGFVAFNTVNGREMHVLEGTIDDGKLLCGKNTKNVEHIGDLIYFNVFGARDLENAESMCEDCLGIFWVVYMMDCLPIISKL